MENRRTNQQNRRLYGLFSQLNIHQADMIADIVLNYTNGRTQHTSELSWMECMQLIKWLESKVAEQRNNLDSKRKGLIKAIFRWYELQGKVVTMEYVKATACRAAGVSDFNKISAAALSRLYAEFCRKQKSQEVMQVEKKTNSVFCIDIETVLKQGGNAQA